MNGKWANEWKMAPGSPVTIIIGWCAVLAKITVTAFCFHFPFIFHSFSFHFPFIFHSFFIHFAFIFHSLSIEFPFISDGEPPAIRGVAPPPPRLLQGPRSRVQCGSNPPRSWYSSICSAAGGLLPLQFSILSGRRADRKWRFGGSLDFGEGLDSFGMP